MSTCPFCAASDQECEHLFALIDRSNATVDGGYLREKDDEVSEAVIARAVQLLSTRRKGRTQRRLSALFNGIHPLGRKTGVTQLRDNLDGYQLFDLFEEACSEIHDIVHVENVSDIPPTVVVEDDAADDGDDWDGEEEYDEEKYEHPGSEIVEWTFYAQNCPAALSAVVAKLRDWDFSR